MKQAQQTASPNTITTSTYFGAQRIKKTVGPPAGPPDTTTIYIYSGTKPIVEYVNGQLSKEYVYSGSTLLATIAGGVSTYHHPDHLSNRVETDSTGAPARTFGQLPYGEVWYETGTADKLKFTSYERDSVAGETGLDYAMFRQYSSGLGRFMSSDLLAGGVTVPQSLNRYSYALNDTVDLIDPLGLCAAWYYDPTADAYVCIGVPMESKMGGGSGTFAQLQDGGPGGGGGANNGTKDCISTNSLNWLQKVQLTAAQFYASLTGSTVGFGAGVDGGAGIGPKGGKWNFGGGGSGSTLIVADASGNAGFLNSVSGGFSAVKTSSASWWGAGIAAGPTFLVSPNPISTIAGPSGSISAGGGAVLGAGFSLTTSGAATFTFGVGAGAEAGVSPQWGTSQFIPFCHK